MCDRDPERAIIANISEGHSCYQFGFHSLRGTPERRFVRQNIRLVFNPQNMSQILVMSAVRDLQIQIHVEEIQAMILMLELFQTTTSQN